MGNANRRAANKRVGRIHNHLIRFADTAENLGLNSEISTNSYITQLDGALLIDDGNLKVFATKYECVIR